MTSATSAMIDQPVVNVHPQFRENADLPGDVLIRCRGINFYVHRAVIYFASPFFSAILDGGWSETDLVRANNVAGDNGEQQQSGRTAGREGSQSQGLQRDADRPSMDTDDAHGSDEPKDSTHAEEEEAVEEERASTTSIQDQRLTQLRHATSASASPSIAVRATDRDVLRRSPALFAMINLDDDDPSTVHEVLHHIYPNLELLVTWFNLSSLLDFNKKYLVPHLQRACTTFLTASLAGKPIEAMAVSERHGFEDIYREASRHVLDNMAAWEAEELAQLTPETLLKLERKRTWFVERLLKLGLSAPTHDAGSGFTCTDRSQCSRELEAQWRALYASTIQYGPPQPSVVWHRLREFGGCRLAPSVRVGCQQFAKSWAQNLFDRMYGLYGLTTHSKTPSKFLFVRLNSNEEASRPIPRDRSVVYDFSNRPT